MKNGSNLPPELMRQIAEADARAKQKAMMQMEQQQMVQKHGADAKLPEGVGLQDGATEAKAGIGLDEIRIARNTLQDYQRAKDIFDSQIIENEKWWQLRHWPLIRTQALKEGKEPEPEPTSAWLQSMIANKHADFMDNYPEANILERESDDRQDAATLSMIIPVLHERSGFEKVYSDASLYKLLHGTSAYGVFWDKTRDVIGDVVVQKIDLLNLFFEPYVNDIQDSRNLFVVDMVDKDVLLEQYPEIEGNLASEEYTVKRYNESYRMAKENKVAVVDWYYKKHVTLRDGNVKRLLHYCKFVGDNILFASENDPAYQERGWYDHGRYPIVLDTLFQMASTPLGYGFLHLGKDAQLYIDKLQGGILQHAIIASKPRYFLSENSGVKADDLFDLNKQVILLRGDLDERNIKRIEVPELPPYVPQVLEMKVNEMKSTTGNEDFNRGTTAGGVTAASAISALQEAGNKGSRNMINASYRVFQEIVYLELELIRQFYDEARAFRITGENGTEYIKLDNSNLRSKPLASGLAERVPIFDIKVKAQKRNPFSRAAQNDLAERFYGMGFFNPQLAEQSLGALEMMEFEGKQKVQEKVSQGQTLLNVIQQMQQMMLQMAAALQLTSGKPIMDEVSMQMQGLLGGGQPQPGAGSSGGAGASELSYADRLAKRAVPDVSEGRGS